MTRNISTLTAELAQAEAGVPNLRPGCEKQVVWAGTPTQQTPVSVVFVHGFSASLGELRPLPDLVAEGLGANLFFTRLMGHGQDGAAMGAATFEGWRADLDEVLEVGGTLGARMLLIGCSTGCTLITDALQRHRGAPVMGACLISPNFGLRHKVAQRVLDLPASHLWGPLIAGAERSFPVEGPEHEKYWTVRYPTIAARPMGDAMRAVRKADLSGLTTPLMSVVNPDDQVIDPVQAQAAAARWGGPTTDVRLTQTPDDHVLGHIMAGDVFSPRQTRPLADRIITWAKSL